MNDTYVYHSPSRIILCIILSIMAVLCVVSIFKSEDTIKALKDERADFADEFLIMFRTNRVILIILFVILIFYLMTNN